MKDLIWAPILRSSSSSSISSSGPGTNLVRIQHGYDRASNRLWRQDPVAAANSAAFDELYAYDGLYRLKAMQRGTLNGSRTAIVGGTATFGQCWTLDATGNWKGFREDNSGSGTWSLVQARSASTANEISAITNSVGSAWANPAYDPNGNMTKIPQPAAPDSGFTGTYDAWNRLVKLVDVGTGHPVQENVFDGVRRRTVQKSYTAGTLAETRHHFYSASWQVLEERVGASTDADRQSVWGPRYIDDLVLRDRDTSGDGLLDERLYAVQDPNWNVVGIVDPMGIVQERYMYDAYGDCGPLSPTFGSRASSSVSWDHLFAGYRFDRSTNLYAVRNRFLNTRVGVWLSRDPVQYDNERRLYEYASANPIRKVDANGLDDEDFDPSKIPGANPTKDNPKCFKINLRDFRKWYEDKHALYTRLLLKELDRGCIGLAAARQACDPRSGPYQTFPENAPNTTCYREEANADAHDCGEHSKFIFAKQGIWKDGKEPIEKADGSVPTDSVTGDPPKSGKYNYISVILGWYWWINHQEFYNADDPQILTICDKPYKGPDYPETIWCATCRDCPP